MKLIQYSINNKINLGVRVSPFHSTTLQFKEMRREGERLVIRVAAAAVFGCSWWPVGAEMGSEKGNRAVGRKKRLRALLAVGGP